MFESSEYHQRMQRLKESVASSDLDALVICSDPNVSYITGTNCESGDRRIILVVPSEGDPALIVPRMEQEKMSAALTVDKVLVYWEKDAKLGRGWEDKLQEALGDRKRIGLDPSTSMEVLAVLDDRNCKLCEFVEDLRVIKSPAEIDLTRRAANYWTKAMNAMLGLARVGVPVGDLKAAGQQVLPEVFSNEPSANSYNTYEFHFFQCSPGSSSPHHVSRPDDVLPHGPSIINSVGAVCGYGAENERTILTGEYTAEHAELFDIAHQAHKLALSLIKPGVPCADVDCAVQDYFCKEGMEEHMRHRVGHGFGLVYHERPYTSEGSSEVYQPGMLISVEPGIYINGVGGFRHSDTVLITESGIENFTSSTPIDRKKLTF